MTQLKKIDQKINQLNLKKNLLNTKLKKHAKQNRRARTRTLIQLGGLIEKSGLMNLTQIQTGEDLQLDHEAFEKAATLFEILSQTYIQHENNSEQTFQKLKEKGIKKMKQQAYGKKISRPTISKNASSHPPRPEGRGFMAKEDKQD